LVNSIQENFCIFHGSCPNPGGAVIEKTHALFPDLAYPEAVRHTVHGEYIGTKDSFMGMDQVEIRFPDPLVYKPGKTDGRQELGKGNDGDFVKSNAIGLGSPLIGNTWI
jgi:hypothetical protein